MHAGKQVGAKSSIHTIGDGDCNLDYLNAAREAVFHNNGGVMLVPWQRNTGIDIDCHMATELGTAQAGHISLVTHRPCVQQVPQPSQQYQRHVVALSRAHQGGHAA